MSLRMESGRYVLVGGEGNRFRIGVGRWHFGFVTLMCFWAPLLEQAFASGEAWMPGPIQVSNLKAHLPQESSFAGPLMGGGSTKELNKWIDERMGAQSPYDASRLLLGVLKVSCQHYGKLRSSNVNSGNSAMVGFGARSAWTSLFDCTRVHFEVFGSVLCHLTFVSRQTCLRNGSRGPLLRCSWACLRT